MPFCGKRGVEYRSELPNCYTAQEDHIGLRKLDESGRLDLGTLPGYHMHFTLQEFEDLIVIPYLTAGSQLGGMHRM